MDPTISFAPFLSFPLRSCSLVHLFPLDLFRSFSSIKEKLFASTPSCFFFPIPVLLSQSKTLWNNLHSLIDLPYPSFAPEPAKFLPSVYVWNSCGKDYQRSTYQTQSSKTSALNPGSWYWRKSHNHKELCQDIVMVSSQLDIYYWSITL